MVLYHRDGRKGTAGPGSTPPVHLEFSHCNKIPSTQLLPAIPHTRARSATEGCPMTLACWFCIRETLAPRNTSALCQDPGRGAWTATLSSQSVHKVKLRPWGTRVPLALLTSGTEPRCCTGPPAQDTSPPSQKPLLPRSWTAETS